MKPTKKDQKKFDLDLKYGEIREDKIRDMLENKKIEVKSERGRWMETGNICIEYESWSKPSGIRATESDYWFHHLCVGDKEYCTLVFHTEVLRTIVKELTIKEEFSKLFSVKNKPGNCERKYNIRKNKTIQIEELHLKN